MYGQVRIIFIKIINQNDFYRMIHGRREKT